MAGLTTIEAETIPTDTLRSVIQRVAIDMPKEASNLILDDADNVRASLFVALDGEHIRDLDQAAEGEELLLMPPMAGG